MPDDVRPIVVVAIGLLGSVEELPDGLREREQRPRKRKPLSELVFTDRWGNAAL
jgi:hypothetical protein